MISRLKLWELTSAALFFYACIAEAQTYPLGPAKLIMTGASARLEVDGVKLASGNIGGVGMPVKLTPRAGWLEIECTGISAPGDPMVFGLFSGGKNPLNAAHNPLFVVKGDYLYGALPLDSITFPQYDIDNHGVYILSNARLSTPTEYKRNHRFALYVCKAERVELIKTLAEIEKQAGRYPLQAMKADPLSSKPHWVIRAHGGNRYPASFYIDACRDMGFDSVLLLVPFWMDVWNPNYPHEPIGWNGPADPRACNNPNWKVAEFIKELQGAGISVGLHMAGVHWRKEAAVWRPDWIYNGSAIDIGGTYRPPSAKVMYEQGGITAQTVAKLGADWAYQDQVHTEAWDNDPGMVAAYFAGFFDTLQRLKYYRLRSYSTGGVFAWIDTHRAFDWKHSATGLKASGVPLADVQKLIDPFGVTIVTNGWFYALHMSGPGGERPVKIEELRAWLNMDPRVVPGLGLSYEDYRALPPEWLAMIRRKMLLARWPTKEALIDGCMKGAANGNDVKNWTKMVLD